MARAKDAIRGGTPVASAHGGTPRTASTPASPAVPHTASTPAAGTAAAPAAPDASGVSRAPAARGTRVAAWACRVAFAAVFAVNVHCALSFVIDPAAYMGGFELAGVPGEAATRGMGVAFLMWNCTYPLVIWQPTRFRALGAVVLAQQVVGLVGEAAILAGLPAGHAVLAGGIARFIAFDAAGLVAMAAAYASLLAVSRRRAS
ncbi:hypothetical protein [Adlercreutzia faecimuris]|uniref:Transmembrane protein n=1 Tax=Adlercreutzia faecimuris TaxID=2897341 RepID=A0ABS9WEA9_9ACTN|nr:hypothetical protein [Adlercreutzia sp. JBNU-10]MCI2241196.1 hypothetical protein [Adlercreutzia sp. JBNU-10]